MLLRIDEVTTLVRLSRPSVYRLMAAGDFPRPVQIGSRAVRWRRADVEAWVEQRPVAGGNAE